MARCRGTNSKYRGATKCRSDLSRIYKRKHEEQNAPQDASAYIVCHVGHRLALFRKEGDTYQQYPLNFHFGLRCCL